MKYEVQYSSYVNVTLDGFVILKRAVKTESFALQVSKANLYRRQTGRACLATRCVCERSSEPWTQRRASLERRRSPFRSYLVRSCDFHMSFFFS